MRGLPVSLPVSRLPLVGLAAGAAGLGLVITTQLVESMNGRIWLESLLRGCNVLQHLLELSIFTVGQDGRGEDREHEDAGRQQGKTHAQVLGHDCNFSAV